MEPRRGGLYEEKVFVTVFSFSQMHSEEWQLCQAIFLPKNKTKRLFRCATLMNLLQTWLRTPIFLSFLKYWCKKMRATIELYFLG